MLLETVFGLGLFAVSLLLLFSLFPTAHKSLTQSKNVAQATGLAREVMEMEVRGRPFPPVAAGPAVVSMPATINGENVTTDFTWQVTVSPSVDPSLRHALVEVRWDEGPVTRSVRMETYVADF